MLGYKRTIRDIPNFLEQRREELAEQQSESLTQRVARLNAQHVTRILELERANKGLRLQIDRLLETICLMRDDNCDPDALARGFDETG